MSLTIPQYLRVSNIQEIEVRFLWDDWKVEEVDMPLDDAFQDRLHPLSQRAIAAFTIGIAEWIIYRFGALSNDPGPVQYLEAAWAQVIDLRYSSLSDVIPEDWTGPVRGPIGVALRRVIFALDQSHSDGDPAWRAGRASKLAEHVIPDPTLYRQWRDHILDRLERVYPLDPAEKLGDVVPREAMDPDTDLDVLETEVRINRFLSGLDYTNNRFLSPPDEMLKRGFVGTPYLFSLEADRKIRYDW
jgi:hypothetical protein